MSIEFKKTVAVFDDVCQIEEAETLLEWLLEHPQGKLNLKTCQHFHTAILQVILVLKPEISYWPQNEKFSGWLQLLLEDEK